MVLLAQLVTEYVADLTDLMSGATRAQEIVDSFKGLTEGPSALADSFNRAGENARLLGEDVAAVMAETSAAIEETTSTTEQFRSKLASDAVAAADEFGARITETAQRVTDFAVSLRDRAIGSLSDFGDKVASAIKPVTDFGSRIGTSIGDAASNAFGKLQSIASSGMSAFASKLDQGKQAISEFSSNVASKFASAAAPVISFGSRVGQTLNQAGMVALGFGVKIKEGVGGAVSSIVEKLDVAKSAVSGFGETVQTTMASVTSGLQRAASGASELSGRASSMGGSVASGFKSAIGGVLEFTSKVGMSIFAVQQLAQTAQGLAQSLLGPAASAEQLQGSLAIFTGSAQAAKQEMENLDAAASNSPFETTAVDRFALKLQSVGISAQDIIPDFKALGDGLDALGTTSSADLSGIADDFAKIKTEGHLTSEIMQSFASKGIDIWSVLEKQTGKTHEALQQMISDGLYPADQAMRDLTTGMEANPLYKGQMANDANVFNGITSTLTSNWNQLMVSFGSPVIKALEPLLKNVTSALASPEFKAFASDVGQKMVDTFDSIGNTVQTKVVPAFAPLAGHLESIAHNVQFLGGQIQALFKNMGPAGQGALAALVTLIAIDLNYFGFLAKAIGLVIQFLQGDQAAPFRNAMAAVGHVLDLIGQSLVANLMPAWAKLQVALQQSAPIWQGLGAVVLLVVGLLVGVVVGLATGIAWSIGWIIQVIQGCVVFWTGAFNFIIGIVMFFVDLLTGHFDKLGGDLGQIFQGIGQMFYGWWLVVEGIFMGLVTFVLGLLGGFVNGIITFFSGLFDTLVGHSIIPDMINAIIDWFMKLPGEAWNALVSMKNKALEVLGDLASKALEAGKHIVQQIADGITNGANSVKNAISGIGQFISDHLPHSPAKVGPLRDLAYQGSEIAGQVAGGMMDGLPQLDTAIGAMTKPVALGLSASGGKVIPSKGGSSSANQDKEGTSGNITHVHIHLNDQEMAEFLVDPLMEKVVKRIRLRGGKVVA